jgi:hypothetical protein
VNRFGSNTDCGLRLVLRKNAIDPDKDVESIQVAGTAPMVAAISRGLIQFALFNEPFVRDAEKLGFKTPSMWRRRRFPFIGMASDQGVGAQNATAGFPVDLGLTEAIYLVQDGEKVDQGADRQVSESKRSGKPRTGLEQLGNDSPWNPVSDSGWREDVARWSPM